MYTQQEVDELKGDWEQWKKFAYQLFGVLRPEQSKWLLIKYYFLDKPCLVKPVGQVAEPFLPEGTFLIHTTMCGITEWEAKNIINFYWPTTQEEEEKILYWKNVQELSELEQIASLPDTREPR